MSYDGRNRSAVSRIFDRATKVQEAKTKMKNELVKQAILKKMQSQQGMKDFKAREDYKQQQKANDPAQTFLRNRYQSEKPLDAVQISEDNSGSQFEEDDEATVSFPADRVVQTPAGKYTTKKNESKDLDLMLINKIEEMRKRNGGKPISDVWERRQQAAKNRLPKSAGYMKEPAEDFSGVASYEPKKRTMQKGPNKATQKVLDGIAADIASRKKKGDFKTDDIIEDIDSNSDTYRLRGVDVGYVKKHLSSIAEEYKRERGKRFGLFGKESPAMEKRGGKWYKKAKDGWELADEPQD